MHLARAPCRQDTTRERDQHTETASTRGRCDEDGIGQVSGAVAVGGIARPLGAGQDDRAWVVMDQIQQNRGLLRRIGAVRDHYPVDRVGLPREQVGDRVADQPDVPEVHAVGAHRHQIHRLHVDIRDVGALKKVGRRP